MKLNKVWAWSSIFSLLLPLATARGQAAINQEALALLAHHREITSGTTGMELSKKYGKDLNKVTTAFLENPKNKNLLNQPEFIELKHKNTLLGNYVFLNEQFDKCIKDKERGEDYRQRLLDNGFNSSLHNFNPCYTNQDVFNFKEIDNLSITFNDLAVTNAGPILKKDLEEQITLNSSLSLLGYKYKFDPEFMKDGTLKENDLANIEKEVCDYPIRGRFVEKRDFCESFGSSFKTDLRERLKNYAQRLTREGKKYSAQTATQELNASIDNLNSKLATIKFPKKSGLVFDDPDFANIEEKKKYDLYIENYLNTVSTGAGSLMLSEKVKDTAGEMRSYNNDNVKKNGNHYIYEAHKKISEDDTKKAISEVGEKIKKQMYDLKQKSTNRNLVQTSPYVLRDQIDDIVKMNPFAAGELLLNNPQYVNLICDAINRISKKEDYKKKRDEYFMVGSAVLGGALLLTGVGTVAGAYLITGSLTSGIAAGTVGGSILGFTALAGGAVELTAVSYYGKKAYEEQKESEKLELAFLTRNGDSQNIIASKELLNSYKEARLVAGISLAALGLSGLNAGRLFNLFKRQPHVSPEEVQNATSILSKISETAVAQKIKSTITLLKSAGLEKMDQFLLALARAAEPTRLRILSALGQSKLTPEALKDIIETSLAAAKKCSVR